MVEQLRAHDSAHGRTCAHAHRSERSDIEHKRTCRGPCRAQTRTTSAHVSNQHRPHMPRNGTKIECPVFTYGGRT
eukprot:7158657-Pyramimonas_sp.AAC.1